MATVRVLAPKSGTLEREAWDKYWISKSESPFAEDEYNLTREEVEKWRSLDRTTLMKV